MLDGRIGRYPSKKDGGWTRKCVIGDTNPPDDDHWMYEACEVETPDGHEFFKQPPSILWDGTSWIPNPLAENVKNLTDGYQYWLDQVPNKSRQWIKVFLQGLFGTIEDGLPVYRDDFNDDFHVSPHELVPLPRLPIYLGWDFGLTPACIVGQVTTTGQLRIIAEFCTDDMGLRKFAEGIRPTLLRLIGDKDVFSTGDPAGRQRDYEEHNAFHILDSIYNFSTLPARTNDIPQRLEAVRYFLNNSIGKGQPAFLLSSTSDRIRKGMNGRYRYMQLQISGTDERYQAKPDKNKYSHPHDALQYLCLRLAPEEATKLAPIETPWSKPLDRVTNY